MLQTKSTLRHAAASRKQVTVTNILSQFNGVAERKKKKQELLDYIKPLKRGLNATDSEKKKVESLASQLEKINPNPRALSSPYINGKWELLYTTSSSILGTSKPALLRPSGPIYQIIDARTLKARNEERAPLFNQVTAALEPLNEKRVAVQFKQFKLFNLIPVNAPPSARGELEITYLDEDLRISRGDKGNLFVLTMDDASVTL